MDSSTENLLRFLREESVRTLAVICLQFGDTGKGKFVDLLAAIWADIIARGTGGANAGHTIKFGPVDCVFHLVPSGILHDKAGKLNVIGNGVALDPSVIMNELGLLHSGGYTYNGLRLSHEAKLVLPQHLLMDRLRETDGKDKIGTTGRGIGPVYEDFVGRIGLTVNDLLNKDVFVSKLKRNLRDKLVFLRGYGKREAIEAILRHEHLGSGRYWSEKTLLDVDEIVETYMAYGKALKQMICDTDALLKQALGKQNILAEGAQGVLLSILHGAKPNVTASDCSLAGLMAGIGLHESDVDQVLGIAKAPYMTRVGGGPFVTEFGGVESEVWCASEQSRNEENFDINAINAQNEFFRGVVIRRRGGEYGATTGRARRTGRLDLPALRYAMQFGGKFGGKEKLSLVLTKLDIMSGTDDIEICTAYEYRGSDYQVGATTLKYGDVLPVAIMDDFVLRQCVPIYEKLPGWKSGISHMKSWVDLPLPLRNIIKFIEERTEGDVRIVSVGADRDETIFVEKGA